MLIWWTLHDVQFAEVWNRLSSVRWIPFVAAIGLATLTFPLRTVRWRYLLQWEGQALPFVPLWHATAIGFMATNLSLARAGEVARAFAARQLTGVRFTTAFGSIAVERVLDGLTLVTLLVLAIWAGGFEADTAIGTMQLGGVVRAAGVVFLVLLLVAAAAVHWPGPALAGIRTVAERFLPRRWAGRAITAVEGLLSGLDVLRSPGRLAMVTLWSFVVWSTGALSFWFAYRAFAIDVPWSASLMLQSLIAFGVAVQFSPGFFGQWEALCRLTLALYAVAAGQAVSFAIGFHLGGFIPITALGLVSLSRAHLHLADLRESSNQHAREGPADA